MALKSIILVLGCLSAFTFLYAQPYTLTGIVMDTSNVPLAGASIICGTQGVISQPDGSYAMSFAEAGPHQVSVRYVGYSEQSWVVVFSTDSTVVKNVVLTETTQLLQAATISSSRYETPLGEQTLSLEIIKPKLIRYANTVALDEVLDKVPGVIVNEDQANIRGGSGWSYGAGSRITVLLDDVPILQADAGTANWDDLPLENISQIEVVKGAASALYGSAALNGIINVRTAYAKAEPETEVSAFYSLYDAPKDKATRWWADTVVQPFESGYSFAHRRKSHKWDVVLGSYGLTRTSYNSHNYNRYLRYNTSLRYRIRPRISAELYANMNIGKSQSFFYFANDSTGVYRADTNTLSQVKRLRYNIDPKITIFDGAGNRHKWMGRIHRVDNAANNNQSNQSWLYYGEYQYYNHWQEAQLHFTTGCVTTHVHTTADLYGSIPFRTRHWGLYGQLDKHIGNRIKLSGGMRFEYNRLNVPDSILLGDQFIRIRDQIESRPVGRLGLTYRAGKATYLRASWGQGYRFPVIAEKFITTAVGGLGIQPNPSLNSETGWSAEIGCKQGFNIGKAWQGYVDLAAFQSEYQDMIEYNIQVDFAYPIPAFFQARNIGDTRIQGIELSMAGQGSLGKSRLSIIGGYTYISPRFQAFNTAGIDTLTLNNYAVLGTEGQQNAFASSSQKNILKYRYRHLGKMDMQWEQGKWSVGAAFVYTSPMEAIDAYLKFLPPVYAHWEKNQKAFTIWDFRMAYQLTPALTCIALVKNLSNTSYYRRPGVMEPTRQFSIKIDVRL